MEDPAIREMADYMEANKDEIWEKLPGNRQVTLLVFREGDQLNFFRVVDRGDGTLTPLSESLSGASVHNGEYEEEVEDAKELTVEQAQENDAVMNKMKSLRAKMENLTLVKKQSKIPRPPSRPKSTSKRRVASVRNVRGSMNTMSRVEPLPPVRGSLERDKKLETIEPADLLSNPGTRSRSGPQVRHSSSQGELEVIVFKVDPRSLLEDHMGPATSSQRVPSTLPSQPDSGSAAERLGLGTAPDARVVTDLVNQANREGKINNIVRTSQRDPLTGLSSSRARISPSPAVLNRVFNGSASVHRSSERLSTPEARQALISAHSMRGRLSGGRDGRIAVSPVCRLPPVVNSSISHKEEIQQTLLPMQQENRPCNKLPMQVIKESSLLTSLLTYLSPRTNCNLWQATVCYLWHCIPLSLPPSPATPTVTSGKLQYVTSGTASPYPAPTPSEGGPSDFVSSLVYPDGSIQTFHSAFSALIYQEHSFQQICGPFYNVECLLKTLVRWGLITFCSS
ncbi:putative AN1-type zinc finger protein 4-like [Apostichopus japonicus]|uniref:Putative AN1-type zinc finger protein 4-like n=1 Tax=Stichopus japonicus TaxID=307972 RepID=A0A2G8LNQ0_STIJA|nr:putative AN1-type zinc finger protein 4-like [Apostichopus japonicus]